MELDSVLAWTIGSPRDYWIVFAAVLGFIGTWNIFNYLYNHLLLKWRFPNLTKEEIERIDKMSVCEFEELLHGIFREQGYKITIPERMGMQNYFVIIKDGVSTAVRFYTFSTKQRLTPNEIYHALTGKVYNHCTQTLLITTTRFTSEAEVMAKKESVELWDRCRLFHEISKNGLNLKRYQTKLLRS